jgi:ADP-dependent NAD(P)H-hydrate dehydratase / NAD(P)H-hydrate epimerase
MKFSSGALKILSASQIREADNFTIENEPISSIDLMERAALACVQWIEDRFEKKTSFIIVCGPGNNGGDGLAIARLLYTRGYDVKVLLPFFTDKFSTDYILNEQRLNELKIEVIKADSVSELPDVSEKVIIDALFGSGLKKSVEGFPAEVIDWMNGNKFKGNRIISIDYPSGLPDDRIVSEKEAVVHADYTLTFQLPKLPFLIAENAAYVGEWQVLDIGLNTDFINSQPSHYHYITENLIKNIHRKRPLHAHKGTFGHALIVSGTYGKAGAAVLASLACLRAGAGLLTVHVPSLLVDVLQTTVPEAMLSADRAEKHIEEVPKELNFSALGIGPGIGTEKATATALKVLIQNCTAKMIIDADGLNILSENKTWYHFLPQGTILTPHPKEFERLAGKSEDSYERLQILKEFARKFNCYVVLKGAYTAIADAVGNVYFNSTGNPGMATAGSGDALTGIITSLCAQGYSSLEACLLGVFVHGLAGDIAAEKSGEEAMIARDIIKSLGEAFKKIAG